MQPWDKLFRHIHMLKKQQQPFSCTFHIHGKQSWAIKWTELILVTKLAHCLHKNKSTVTQNHSFRLSSWIRPTIILLSDQIFQHPASKNLVISHQLETARFYKTINVRGSRQYTNNTCLDISEDWYQQDMTHNETHVLQWIKLTVEHMSDLDW
jgi:hypothetical protein